ncbi:F-box domain [Dillenia turbinata]|uniref:F-box domain n=1 Tax=Dillenia turbinata TaxID=194707 RepID=A0AAN8V539_9MAGN
MEESKDHEFSKNPQKTPIQPESGSDIFSQQFAGKEVEPRQTHEALLLVLAYLPLLELLAMSEVSKSLRDAVNNDVLIWLDIIVERPLNLRLTNDKLLYYTSKARGRLTTLALMNCMKITDDGLQRLYVPGCTGLTPQGVITAVKTLTEHKSNLRSLRISGIYDMNKEHLETIRSLMQSNPAQNQQQKQQPRFYQNHRKFFTAFKAEGDQANIDLEICPKCDDVRLVFDCPKEACKRKHNPVSKCRACSFCIPRCAECGVCVKFGESEHAACHDTLCLDCWLRLPKCNICNNPYCTGHSSGRQPNICSAGFVCDICISKFTVRIL